MRVFSHRGVCDVATENTREAFAAAVALGVDGIETDVHRTSDDALVLHHDRHVGGRAIAACTRAEINDAAGYLVPTVQDCLDEWPELIWNLEIKAKEAAPLLRDVLRRRDAERVVVSSFHHPAAVLFGQSSVCSVGVLVAHHPVQGGWPHAAWQRHGVDIVVAVFDVLDASLVASTKDAGFAVWAYGPVDAADHARCRDLGLDAVITDSPAFLL